MYCYLRYDINECVLGLLLVIHKILMLSQFYLNVNLFFLKVYGYHINI